VLAGALSGLMLTVVQQLHLIPLLLRAEIHEETNRGIAAPVVLEHEHEAWRPENGWERNLFTAGANVVLGVGFALLLGAAAALHAGKLDWRSGVAWGIAGYGVFFLAPCLGLPPELPGTEAVELTHRQVWWIATVICTATGLALLSFSRASAIRISGAFLLVIPHVVGAPQPTAPAGTAPAELVRAFIIAAVFVNALFWLSLGGLYGFFYKKLR
jgi:cobalt transporter subunit CbtA